VLPLSVGETYSRGLQLDVPVMTGYNLDEMGAVPQPGITLSALRESAKQTYGPMTDELFTLYPATNDMTAGESQNAFSRDRNRTTVYFWATAWKQKARSNVYTYFWTHAPQDPRGASHGAEIRFVFNTLDLIGAPANEQDRKAAETASSYWANFVIKADPNGPGLPPWPAYDGRPDIMVLGDTYGTMPVAEPARLDFMKRFFASQKRW
jgi:carboxylesterase type B